VLTLGSPACALSRPSEPVIWLHIVAAMTAGATGTIVTNPLWLIKTRFMVSLPSRSFPVCLSR
jgi:hypothetical protein